MLGRVIAAGTATQLKARTGTQVVDVLLAGEDAAAARAALGARLAPADLHVDEASRRLAIVARDGLGTLLTAAQLLQADGIAVADISLRQRWPSWPRCRACSRSAAGNPGRSPARITALAALLRVTSV